jgi:radical SAM superfamily enzyme YgiQ (UPF0313 family)
MKILFVYPRFPKYLESFPGVHFAGSERFAGYSYPPALGIPSLIAVTPEHHEVEFVDENVGEVDFGTDADLVAVSFFTPQAAWAYDICDRFRKVGKRVIVGGVHPTVRTDEAAEHADIVCVGEAELIWAGILDDIERGEHRSRYSQPTATPASALPTPARSAIYEHPAGERYDIHLDYLELSRGCDMRCGACVVPKVQGTCARYKDIGQVVEEVASMRYPMCFITDDVIFMHHANGHPQARVFLLDVFGEIGRLGAPRGFFTSTVPIYQLDSELAPVMAKAGATVSYTTFGFDPISNAALTRGSARFRAKMIDQTKMLQDTGMLVYAAFHLGFDDHTPAIVDNILTFCEEADIRMAQFCLRTPWPGTVMWDDLVRQGRILHTDWRRYNGAHVTFQPRGMTERELGDAFVTLWQEYSERYHILNDLQRTEVVDLESFTRVGARISAPPNT